MNILLISPPYNTTKYRLAESLGIKYLSSFLQLNGIHSDIIDAPILRIPFDKIIEQVTLKKYDLIGISLQFNAVIETSKLLSQKIKEHDPEVKICLGGNVASFNWEQLFKETPEIDFIVIGEGEQTFYELIQNLNKPNKWKEISGLSFRYKNKIKFNSNRSLIKDIDLIPFPKRDNLSTLKVEEPYHYTVISSRGCPFSCSFCSVPSFYSLGRGANWRNRTAHNVVDEIEILYNDYNVIAISFADDNFIGSSSFGKNRAIRIASELIRREISIVWSIECRVDDIDKLTFTKLYSGGLRHVFLGAESGSDRSLRIFNKKTTVNKIFEAVNILRNIGIDVDCHFIPFHPYTDLNDLSLTFKFMKELEVATYENVTNKLIIHEGAPIKTSIEMENKLKKDKWDYYYEFQDPRIKIIYNILMDKLSDFRDEKNGLISAGYNLLEAKSIVSNKLTSSALYIVEEVRNIKEKINNKTIAHLSEELISFYNEMPIKKQYPPEQN